MEQVRHAQISARVERRDSNAVAVIDPKRRRVQRVPIDRPNMASVCRPCLDDQESRRHWAVHLIREFQEHGHAELPRQTSQDTELNGERGDIHTVPRGSGCANEKEGGDRASSLHDTKDQAIAAGREQAKREKVDDPFAPGEDWWHNACLNFSFEPWVGYAGGYKRAGHIMVAYVEANRRDQDYLVYPILFNYRQYIELTLKWLIRDARQLLDEPGGTPAGHTLENLWNTTRPLLRRIEPRGEKDLDNVEGCINRFAEVDPTSQAFRYPVDMAGEPSLPGLSQINLRQVRDVVERMSGLFDGALSQISALLDCKWDAEEERRAIEADMRREMEADYRD